MGVRKGSGIMALKLGKKRKRYKHVKLTTDGLKLFQSTMGTKEDAEMVFKMGLFTKEASRKGALLEFGNDNQVARPWLSSVVKSTSRSQRRIIKAIGHFAREAFAGRDVKEETKDKLLSILQAHLYEQNFQADRLKPVTVERKRSKGAKEPTLIGLDSFEMASRLAVRTKGRLNRRVKKGT